MNGWSKETSLWLGRVLGISVVLAMGFLMPGYVAAQTAAKPWPVPAAAMKVKNPVPATPKNLAAAKKVFQDNCTICHGDQGKGDGPGASALTTKPANFTDPKLMKAETDGSIFYKMSEGRDLMPAWKDVLPETQRWELVNYIRQLGKNAAKH